MMKNSLCLSVTELVFVVLTPPIIYYFSTFAPSPLANQSLQVKNATQLQNADLAAGLGRTDVMGFSWNKSFRFLKLPAPLRHPW